jgi:acetolactate decarboxylase
MSKFVFTFLIGLFVSFQVQAQKTKNEKIVYQKSAETIDISSFTIQTLDTDFSKGRLKNQQTISVNDLTKMHGHLCDGLVLGFLGLREALYILFPDSVVDRTNVRIISKSSPCITDVAVYLTGGRYQFNTFYVDDSSEYLYIVQRIDNQKIIGVNPIYGLVPAKIKELGSLAVKNELDACGLDTLRKLEDELIVKLTQTNVNELFVFTPIDSLNWKNPLEKTFLKTDILNKYKVDCKKD